MRDREHKTWGSAAMYWLRLWCTKSDEEPKHPKDWIECDRFLVAGDIACGFASLTPARVSSERDKSGEDNDIDCQQECGR